MHEKLDILHWKQTFSLSRMKEEHQAADVCMISGSYDIAVVEQLREASFANLADVERRATDIFIWKRGEPEQRALTKISGLPYWDARKPWPTAPSGASMNFVAQMCFADSYDLLPPLPGDLLLIFIEGKEWKYGDQVGYHFSWGNGDQRDSAVSFEWVSLGTFPLIASEEIPATPWKIVPCYGTIYRTWDYPTVDGFAYPEIDEHIPEVLEATKIGGKYPYDWVLQENLGCYLCTLCSVSNSFLNEGENKQDARLNDGNLLTIGDVGLMNCFLASDGTVRWVAIG